MDVEEERHAWQTIERSWETEVQERADGTLVTSMSDNADRQRLLRRRLATYADQMVRRGMLRYLVLAIDLSSAVEQQDSAPVHRLCSQFVREFFDHNPLSRLAIIMSRKGIAQALSELSADVNHHTHVLSSVLPPKGNFSLEHTLLLARDMLRFVPRHGSREFVLLSTSLNTCDPGDVFHAVKLCQEENIRCSIVSRTHAEVHVFRVLVSHTGGKYTRPGNTLSDLAVPPAETATTHVDPCWIAMGFPRRRKDTLPAMCVCHGKLTNDSFPCPRCYSRVCSLPMDCPVCHLPLVAGPNLARSHHHLLPVPTFSLSSKNVGNVKCFGCGYSIEPGTVSICNGCNEIFCVKCDVFVHDSLYNCPGCLVSSSK